MSFFNNFIIIPIGVTIKKNMHIITMGAIIAPSNKPNLNHILFRGLRIFDLKKEINKKITDIKSRIYIGLLPDNIGHKEKIIKIAANT